ncbi:MAG TPA: SDR family NAD(P)-dependent oxidoreductase [Burkholderiaceae bacterium]|nr:SDR family NAD(P)-dependent oxidoreductase [Burkholderiaceae bacterium]
MEFKGLSVLVVGASSGIGKELALELADRGARVMVAARRADRLEAVAREAQARGGQCIAHAVDAQDSEAAERLVQACVQAYGGLDLLVLNAGGAPALDLRVLDAPEVLSYMRSNYDVAVNVLMPALHHMRERRSGTVAVTNSLAGLIGVPLQGPYSAAKGALRLLIDTARVEFAGDGIHFVSIYPGFIATEAVAGDGMKPQFELSEAQAVAHMLRAIGSRRMDYAFPWRTKMLVRLATLLPKRLTVRVLRGDVPDQPRRPVKSMEPRR